MRPLPSLLQEKRRWETLISDVKVGFGSFQTRLSNWNEDRREEKRRERPTNEPQLKCGGHEWGAPPIFPGDEKQSGLGEINQDQTWKCDCLLVMVIHLDGSRKPRVGIAEIPSSLWVPRIRLVLLDETVCYWCHVYLKPSGSAPSDPKMTRYDDTTFRSHDPPGSVSSDEQSEWCYRAESFIYTHYFSWKSSWNVLFKSFPGSVSSCSAVSEVWRQFFWVRRRPAGWCSSWALLCRVCMLCQCLRDSFSGILRLPPTVQGQLMLDEGPDADLQWKCWMFFSGNDSSSSSETMVLKV